MLPAFAVTQITASGIERRVCKVQVPALDTGTRNAVETSCSLQMGVDPPPRRASAQDWPSAPILCLGVSMCILAATDTRDHAHLVAMEGETPKLLSAVLYRLYSRGKPRVGSVKFPGCCLSPKVQSLYHASRHGCRLLPAVQTQLQ